MTESKPAVHTATPWRKFRSGSEGVWIKPDSGNLREDLKIIGIFNGRDLLTDDANADFAVRAVNSHAALVEALRGYVAVSRCENPIRVPLPNPEGYAEEVRCEPCGKCRWCAAERALKLAEEGL